MLTKTHVPEETGRIRAVRAGAQDVPSVEHLKALRIAQLKDVTRHLAASSVRVALYALVEPGQNPAEHHVTARALATREGWNVERAVCDETAPIHAPGPPPQLARLYAEVSSGALHGIAAPSRTHFTVFSAEYADILDALRARGGFLALAHDETSPQPLAAVTAEDLAMTRQIDTHK